MKRIVGSLGHGTADFIVETTEVAEVLNKWAEKQHARIESGYQSTVAGPLEVLAGEFAQRTGRTHSAAARRLFTIRACESKATNRNDAEALLLAIDDDLFAHDIPQFPAGRKAAREMVEVWCEDWSELDQKRLVEKLFRFSQGYFSVDKIENTDLYALLEAEAVAA